MTTIAHSVSYGLIAYSILPKKLRIRKYIILISMIIGALPDLLRVILNETWNGTYHFLHEIVWYNFIFFLHTIPDYLVHLHSYPYGWAWYAYVIEVLFWVAFTVYVIYKVLKARDDI